MKNLFKVHLFFYLFALIFFITGFFKEFLMITSIILIHELGHIFGAYIFKWHIEKVIILPIGGLCKFKYSLNKSLLEEFIITILGPFFQVVLMFFVDDVAYLELNKFILYFNLLPIYPLDGSKIINILSCKLTSYCKSKYITSIVSFVFILCLLIIFKYSLTYIVVLILLFKETIIESIKIKYYFNKFLLERYLYKYHFCRVKTINKIKDVCKGKRHILYKDGVYITETSFLKEMFDKKI